MEAEFLERWGINTSVMSERVMNLSGCQWSHDYLFNRKELKKRTTSVFDRMLKTEIEKLEEGESVRDGSGNISETEEGEG